MEHIKKVHKWLTNLNYDVISITDTTRIWVKEVKSRFKHDVQFNILITEHVGQNLFEFKGHINHVYQYTDLLSSDITTTICILSQKQIPYIERLFKTINKFK